MRREMQPVRRADMQEQKTLQFISRDLEDFTKRARNAAMILCNITDICTSLFGDKASQREVASKLYAIVGALSSLEEIACLSPEQCLLTEQEERTLLDWLARCETILLAINVDEEHLKIDAMSDARFMESESQHVLDLCFEAVTGIAMSVRAQHRERIEEHDDNDTFEVVHAEEALGYKAALLHASTFTTVGDELHCTNTSPPVGPSASSDSPPHAPQLSVSSHKLSTDYESCRLPTKDNMAKYGKKDEIPPVLLSSTVALSDVTPAATRESTPGLEPAPDRGNLRTSNDQTPNHKLKDTAPPANAMFNLTKAITPSPLGPNLHLEAYILCPHTDTLVNSVTWTYKIELLPLTEASIQDHVAKLGTEYSIMEAVRGLLPCQLRLVQERTIARNGYLLAVQYGAAADMVTPMGTFQVKPVIFVIKTNAEHEGEDLAEKTKGLNLGTEPSRRIFASRNQSVQDSTLGHFPPQPATVPPTSFASPTTMNSAYPPPYIPTSVRYSSVDAYRTNSEGQGDPWFLEEADGSSYGSKVRYMTLTFSARHKHKNVSLEEIRLADYAAGRNDPAAASWKQHFPASYPWEERPSNSAPGVQHSCWMPTPTDKTKDEPSSKPATGGGLFSDTSSGGGLFSGASSGAGFLGGASSGGGLFGGSSGAGLGPATTSPPKCTLFGQQSTASNATLFGTPPAPSSGSGLFGGASTAPSTGPFGGAANAGQVRGSLFGSNTASPSVGPFSGALPFSGTSLFGSTQSTPTTGIVGTPAPQSGGGLFSSKPRPSATPSSFSFGNTMASAGPSGAVPQPKRAIGCFGDVTSQPPRDISCSFGSTLMTPNPFSKLATTRTTLANDQSTKTTDQVQLITSYDNHNCSTSPVIHSAAEQTGRLFDACEKQRNVLPKSIAERWSELYNKQEAERIAKQTPEYVDKLAPSTTPVTTSTLPNTASAGRKAGFQPSTTGSSSYGTFVAQFASTAKTYEQLTAERKQAAKEDDYDSNEETEEEWSAKYDKREAERVAKQGMLAANKQEHQMSPPPSKARFTVREDGVAEMRPYKSLAELADSELPDFPGLRHIGLLERKANSEMAKEDRMVHDKHEN